MTAMHAETLLAAFVIVMIASAIGSAGWFVMAGRD